MLVICMDEQIRRKFVDLKVTGQRFAISPEEKREKDLSLISYLNSIIENEIVTEFQDIGFCYWNISDNYALLKDGHSLFDNHRKFCEHIKNQDNEYLYWLVCDATQRLTLEKDGYSSFWWDLYRKAVEQNGDSKNYFAEFHLHRAALYTNNHLKISQDNFHCAKLNFEKLLSKIDSTSEYSFYKTIYLSLISRFSTVDSKKICELSRTLFEYLSFSQISNDFLVGEWKSIITPFDKRKQGVVGITSAINALIYCDNVKEAKDLYFDACNVGLPKNKYIEARLKDI